VARAPRARGHARGRRPGRRRAVGGARRPRGQRVLCALARAPRSPRCGGTRSATSCRGPAGSGCRSGPGPAPAPRRRGTTSIATAAETGRRSRTGGSSEVPGRVASDSFATASAAAAMSRSVMCDAAGDRDAEAQAGEHEGVVGLRDLVGHAVRAPRGERAAGGDQRAPSVQPARRRVAPQLWVGVGQRHDGSAVGVWRPMSPDDLRRERSGLGWRCRVSIVGWDVADDGWQWPGRPRDCPILQPSDQEWA
jgi:hypothetical protein